MPRASVRPSLSMTLFPCSGRLTWAVSVDGIHLQQFMPVPLEDAASEDDDSPEDGDTTSSSTSSTSSSEMGTFGRQRSPQRSRRQEEFDNDWENVDYPDVPSDQADTDTDVYGAFLRSAKLPPEAGLGESGGQTVFTFRDDPPSAGLYQLTVFNVGHERAAFNIFSTTTPANQPFADLPKDPQVKVTHIGQDTADIAWYPSNNDHDVTGPLTYCVLAAQRSKLSPSYVQSSGCSAQTTPPFDTPLTPAPPAIAPTARWDFPAGMFDPVDLQPGPAIPTDGNAILDYNQYFDYPATPGRPWIPSPTEHTITAPAPPAIPEIPLILPTGVVPEVFLSSVQCTPGNRHRLTNLSHATRYHIEVLAIDQRTGRARAYTSALLRTNNPGSTTQAGPSGAAMGSGVCYSLTFSLVLLTFGL